MYGGGMYPGMMGGYGGMGMGGMGMMPYGGVSPCVLFAPHVHPNAPVKSLLWLTSRSVFSLLADP